MDSDSDDDFVVYGTRRELDEDDIVARKRPKSIADQTVKDKQGRQRFHGAFTGGFSAGFFNTVGSVEGWTPQTFKSSRSKRADNHGQKPEDFMDEEDTGEFGFAPKTVQVKNDYDSIEENPKKRKFAVRDRSALGHHALNSILKPARSSVGIRILKRMGWRVGQGVGPRLTKKEKKHQRQEISQTKKIYGCSLPESEKAPEPTRSHSGSETTDSDEGDDTDITFAPDDYDPFLINPKSDSFGIGYKGLDRRPVLSNHFSLFEPPVTVKEKSKQLTIQGKGFGVGAMEDEDEDIYAVDDISNYDFSLESRPSTSKAKANSLKALPSPNEPITGFVASTITLKKNYFPPPRLPPNFQPIHVVKKSRFEPSAVDQEDNSKKKILTATDRCAIIDGAPPSDAPPSKQCTEAMREDNVEKAVPKPVADGVFRPFVAYPDKQKRYEQYLVLAKNGKKDQLSKLQPLSMTDWERERERLEFEQASKLYQPLSAAFSDRFVVASQADDSTDPLVEVKRTADTQNDRRDAAKRKMFGPLTRVVRDWAPASLLCKRFNIPDPNVRDTSNEKKKRPKFSVFNFLDASTFNAPSVSSETAASDDTPTVIKQEVNDVEVEEQPNEQVIQPIDTTNDTAIADVDTRDQNSTISKILETGEEPSSKEDLYKAIFLSSSEDESNDEEPDPVTPAQSAVGSSAPAPIVNALRNTSPPRGIFANLDLDALNARKRDSDKEKESVPTEKSENNEQKNSVANARECSTNPTSSSELDTFAYGPALPTKPIAKEITKMTIVYKKPRDDDKWVEATSTKKNKKHKKDRKSKSHHKHKKSKKHKR
ncbi:hypothetical protein LSTR_LSTR006244 [Laodelphax striatellus]|uniref:G-patch domain-containing protein n=1 Tax=Laodelphax striatellus TaxID=195883 RepID=A0A482XRT9_LAOST|nr:hypothetical protein LSTR_LSTR006244 [Laodelphax striatellus]